MSKSLFTFTLAGTTALTEIAITRKLGTAMFSRTQFISSAFWMLAHRVPSEFTSLLLRNYLGTLTHPGPLMPALTMNSSRGV